MNAKNDNNSNEAGEQNKLTEPAVIYGNEPQAVATQDELYKKVMNYWPVLTIEKKQLILDLMRIFVEDERPVEFPKEEWDRMTKYREDYLSGKAKTYTQEEAREILRNPEKRNALLNSR